MDRYEEALEKARAEYEKAREQGYTWLMALLEGMFPELKESEDERIRKWIIEEIKATHDYDSPTSKKCVDDALAYLERQKESTWTKEDESFRKHILPRILNPKGWTIEQVEADRKLLKEFVERQKNKWLEKKEEHTEELPIRLNGVMQEYVKAGKDEEEQEYRLKCYQLFWDALGDPEFFKQKEQKFTEKRDYSDLTDLERAIHRGFLVVGVENVPVTIIKETAQDCLAWMKPAEWSEEDADFINMLILHFNYLINKGGDSVETYKSYIKGLKSLRPPQYCENCKLKRSVENWKPSEEQMEVFVDSIYFLEQKGFKDPNGMIESLYQDLKKL